MNSLESKLKLEFVKPMCRIRHQTANATQQTSWSC